MLLSVVRPGSPQARSDLDPPIKTFGGDAWKKCSSLRSDTRRLLWGSSLRKDVAVVNFRENCATKKGGEEFARMPGRHKPSMTFDAQGIFANLAEKERLKGHHSPEGRAIRTLSRALHGWSSGNLSAGDVVVLCDQAIEDWLKSRMKVSEWSTKNANALLRMAAERELLTATEADRLWQVHEMRSRSTTAAAADAESALQCSIQIVEERWE